MILKNASPVSKISCLPNQKDNIMEQKTFLVLNDQNEVIRVFVVNHSEYLSDTSYRCVCPVNGSESFLISQKNIYLDDIHNFTRIVYRTFV